AITVLASFVSLLSCSSSEEITAEIPGIFSPALFNQPSTFTPAIARTVNVKIAAIARGITIANINQMKGFVFLCFWTCFSKCLTYFSVLNVALFKYHLSFHSLVSTHFLLFVHAFARLFFLALSLQCDHPSCFLLFVPSFLELCLLVVVNV